MKLEKFQIGDLDRLFLNDPDTGQYLVHRDLFRDERIFELEMKYIFERNWVFLGLESEVPNPNDYVTRWIGRTPVIVWRNQAGDLAGFINSCPHKGARVCHLSTGSANHLVCGYHGWTYDSSGRNVLVKDEGQGAYAEPFGKLDHGLIRIKFGSYRGLLFGSLSDEVPSLEDHLGETATLLDLVVDQGPHGVEAVPGVSTYTYDANWKMQIENCVDGYHLTSAHPSFMNIVARRKAGESKNQQVKSIDFRMLNTIQGGNNTFPRGHAVIWGDNPLEAERPGFGHKQEMSARCGETKTKWMLATRNLTIYPNVQFAENASLQMRMIRPLSAGKTEMTIYCVGPKGESAEAREIRIRQYEDFFNTSGLATPDDTVAYEDCQFGYAAPTAQWLQGYCRGMTQVSAEPDRFAQEVGVRPETSVCGPMMVQDETVMHGSYRAWMQMIKDGLRGDGLL